MGKLIMWNLVTLDGCFDGPGQWSLDWHKRAVAANFHDFALEQLRSADMLIFGRVTYEGMARYWRTATDDIADFMNGLPKFDAGMNERLQAAQGRGKVLRYVGRITSQGEATVGLIELDRGHA